MKVERVSYDVITPSAAGGILEAIHWKPAIRWVVCHRGRLLFLPSRDQPVRPDELRIIPVESNVLAVKVLIHEPEELTPGNRHRAPARWR
jgi:CRISPR-associated protein (Cas_Cas5)